MTLSESIQGGKICFGLWCQWFLDRGQQALLLWPVTRQSIVRVGMYVVWQHFTSWQPGSIGYRKADSGSQCSFNSLPLAIPFSDRGRSILCLVNANYVFVYIYTHTHIWIYCVSIYYLYVYLSLICIRVCTYKIENGCPVNFSCHLHIAQSHLREWYLGNCPDPIGLRLYL